MSGQVFPVVDGRVRIEKLELGPFGTNAYIVVCAVTCDSVLIDAPAESRVILDKLQGTNPRYVLITHSHADHTGALEEVYSRLNVPLAAHPADSKPLPVEPDLALQDGDTLACGKLRLDILHTPGHTPGSLCLKIGPYLISGDTLFPGGPGKTWSPAGLEQIIRSITTKIFPLPGDTRVFPGHGLSTTVEKEKEQYARFASRPRDPDLCGGVTWLGS